MSSAEQSGVGSPIMSEGASGSQIHNYGINSSEGESDTGAPSAPTSNKTRRQRFMDLVQPIINFVLRRKPGVSPPSPPRAVYFRDPEGNESNHFCSNKISTTKYSVLTFIPLFLFDQFRRYANLFFLFISLVQQIPHVSPTGRFTTLIPLSLVLLATAAKEIIEDTRRRRADGKLNSSITEVLCEDTQTRTEWIRKKWKEVKVGDIVRVRNKSSFPADLLLLSSSGPHGICYVETSNLDGETNLKIRQSHPKTSGTDMDGLRNYSLECEGPNNRLYEFAGNLRITTSEGRQPEVLPLQADQILLRGSQLRNTTYIDGLVVYTGHDSKLLQNTTSAPLKRSRMDHVTNRQVIYMVGFLLSLAVLSSLITVGWNAVNTTRLNHWYLANSTSVGREFLQFFFSILTFIILYNNLIPISLIVTLEIVKFCQTFFINWDRDMYDEVTNTPALARNSNLNEELGQVKFVFSDKTGTLTENIMAFKKCSIAGKTYGMDTPGEVSLEEAIKEPHAQEDKDAIINFMLVLSVCHTVVPEREGGGEGGEVVYRASSPDEEALVKAAKKLGVVFKERTPDHVTIDVLGKEEKYEMLNLLEFNSTRKRMSVIVKTPSGEIKLFCKGADNVIYERMTAHHHGDDFSKVTGHQLELFARDGLRTLCIAERKLKNSEYERWNKDYHAASISLSNKEDELDRVAEEIEKELTLLGATAIEDKLQQGVPEAIHDLREAGIKVWVLTGDKQETAINIGFASRQLTSSMTLLEVNDLGEEDGVKETIKRHFRAYGETLHRVSRESNVALIIDGKALTSALMEDTKNDFLQLALSCKSVICCRVSPLQKAEVVRLVRENCKNEVTLAIGDGANDVGMIQAAHIGVGISGREGLQATLASDYAIAQFRFLLKLLLVHGAWNYRRLAIIILFSFYKNICLYIIEFWFAMFNGFSGQPLFERWTIGLFNILFTIFGLVTFGLYEQDVRASVRLAKPRLYKPSQEGKYFNMFVFFKWVSLSIFHSMVLFFGILLMLPHVTLYSTGVVTGLWYAGNTVYSSVVIVVNLKLALESQFWPWIHHLTVWGSIFTWFLFLLIYSHFWPTFPIAVDMVGQDYKLYGSLFFYSALLLASCLAMLPDVYTTVIQKLFFPTELDKERLKDIMKEQRGSGNYRLLKDDEDGRSMSVSYQSTNGSEKHYGDGLEHEEDGSHSPLLILSESRKSKPFSGYAFAQEDHGNTSRALNQGYSIN